MSLVKRVTKQGLSHWGLWPDADAPPLDQVFVVVPVAETLLKHRNICLFLPAARVYRDGWQLEVCGRARPGALGVIRHPFAGDAKLPPEVSQLLRDKVSDIVVRIDGGGAELPVRPCGGSAASDAFDYSWWVSQLPAPHTSVDVHVSIRGDVELSASVSLPAALLRGPSRDVKQLFVDD